MVEEWANLSSTERLRRSLRGSSRRPPPPCGGGGEAWRGRPGPPRGRMSRPRAAAGRRVAAPFSAPVSSARPRASEGVAPRLRPRQGLGRRGVWKGAEGIIQDWARGAGGLSILDAAPASRRAAGRSRRPASPRGQSCPVPELPASSGIVSNGEQAYLDFANHLRPIFLKRLSLLSADIATDTVSMSCVANLETNGSSQFVPVSTVSEPSTPSVMHAAPLGCAAESDKMRFQCVILLPFHL